MLASVIASLRSAGFASMGDGLYYKIEDRCVFVFGERPLGKRILTRTLSEGAIRGGFTDRGQLFGSFTSFDGEEKQLVWGGLPVEDSTDKAESELVSLKDRYAKLQKNYQTVLGQLKEVELQLEGIRAQATKRVEELKAEYEKKSRVRRLQFESVPYKVHAIEGMTANVWEMEDPNGKTRYLVVASSAPGTPSNVEKQWKEELRMALEDHVDPEQVHLIIAPHYASISLNEILPIVEENVDDSCQF